MMADSRDTLLGLDDSETLLTRESATAATTTEGRLTVLVLSQTFVGSYELPETGEATIGRSSSVEIYVDDPLVSRRHAIVSSVPCLTIRDLGSSNGTMVR